MLSVTKKPFILSAIMLNVIMLSVMVLPHTLFVDTCGVSLCYIMKNTYWLFQVKFITEYTNVQHIIITQI